MKPACLASDKHVSRDVSPPSSGMSSLLHAIGATPNFTDIFFIFVRIIFNVSIKNNKKDIIMKVNVALFGLGRIGIMHAKNIHQHNKFKLKYIYDVNQKISLKLQKI